MNQMPFSLSNISEIDFTEKFFCRVEISNVPRNEWHSEKFPEGSIEIRIPYQVWDTLINNASGSSSSIARLKRTIISFLTRFIQSSNDFKWNNLKLSNHKFTDLGSRLYLSSGIREFPLRKILTQTIQEHRNTNSIDEIDRLITIEYLPDNPRLP